MGDHQVYLLVLNCRLSPRQKTERNDPETDGAAGGCRRMFLRWKAKTGGPTVLMPFHLGDIRLCHPFWPSQTRRRTSPRRMTPRRITVKRMTLGRMSLRRMTPRQRKAETDAPETYAPETDASETEEDRDGGRRDGRCVCFCLFALLKDCGRLQWV